MKELVPKGYHIKRVPLWGDMLCRDKGDYPQHRLTDRTFSQIDHYLGYLPSELIAYYRRKRKSPVRVLDLGGGRNSGVAAQLQKELGSGVHVINVDLVHNKEIPLPVSRVQADTFFLPLQDATIDLVYSFQLLPFLENEKTYMRSFREIARVLKPGGVALLDEQRVIGMLRLGLSVTRLGMSMHVAFLTRTGNNAEPGQVVSGPPRLFLMMAKDPMSNDVFSMRGKVFGHI